MPLRSSTAEEDNVGSDSSTLSDRSANDQDIPLGDAHPNTLTADLNTLTADLNDYTPFLPLHVSSARSRLKHFLDFVDGDNHIALSRIPEDVSWGDGYLSRTVCLNGRPLVTLIMGELVRHNTTVHAPTESTSFSISVELFRNIDRLSRDGVLSRVGGTSYGGEPFLDAFVHYASSSTTFKHIYDAAARYRSKSLMRKLSVDDLRAGDVVLLECTIVKDRRAGAGERDDVHFRLHAVSLVVRAPRSGGSLLG